MFGEVVRNHRLRQCLTQEELAAATGLGLRTIRYLEAGQIHRPRPSTVRLLADAFHLDEAERDGTGQPNATTPAPERRAGKWATPPVRPTRCAA